MRIETIGDCTLYNGDCLEVMAGLPENSVDAIVTDPPYHLTSIVKRFATGAPAQFGKDGAYQRASAGFMGQVWDGGDIAFRVETWAACLRVLKPGGYIMAFASTRGFGRMSVAIEDAGFITHPMIAWLFGSGFPKATQTRVEGMDGWRYGGQALKPAIEPIYMGQKPFSEKTGTANIKRWGTGAINIDGCRVGGDARPIMAHNGRGAGASPTAGPQTGSSATGELTSLGRYPANLIHDGSEAVLAEFPETTSGAVTG
ncbi:site-specific DNA-methyltransferase, partial [Mesorhizobium sp. BR1-1-7]|uniref:DNA methyltransferase n=1 Tax=Mesorhizobium sp. BR1-1-7 TaxID=2876647 RepID=UPI002985A7C9|nr:site-specific DNA-methyltransferase [Mesorhizobium sp. BR1-1-7]